MKRKVNDDLRFLKRWAEDPFRAGAIMPSSRQLARLMARGLEGYTHGPVLEIGPGTGAVTDAILEQGVSQKDLVLCEYDPVLADILQKRYASTDVVCGDAYQLSQILGDKDRAPFSAIISSLPLLVRPTADRLSVLRQALSVSSPNAPFIQFSYGFTSPISVDEDEFSTEKSRWIILNLPPARVWTYRKVETETVSAGKT